MYKKSTDSSVTFSIRTLDTQCLSANDNQSNDERQKIFDHIFGNNTWGGISRSGPGSTIHGAFNWIQHLRKFLIEYEITSVADIPCGDTFWQFAIREMNTLSKLYFGGDIVTSIIEQNKVWYAEHANKIFAYWDLVKCPIPTFSFYNRTSTVRGKFLIFNRINIFLYYSRSIFRFNHRTRCHYAYEYTKWFESCAKRHQ